MKKNDMLLVLSEIKSLIANKNKKQALELLTKLHIQAHVDFLLHFKVHWQWMRLGITTLSAGIIIKQILPLIFAIPVTFCQRYFGLVLARHRAD